MAWNADIPRSIDIISDFTTALTGNWAAIQSWTNQDHYGLSCAASGSHMPGVCSVLAISSSASIDALTDVPCGFGFATNIMDFEYNTGSAWVVIGGPIASGTKMLFYADTAPSGWTLDTALNDKLVYITKGSVASGETGGSACSSGTWQFTSHTHTGTTHAHGGTTGSKSYDYSVEAYSSGFGTWGTASHSHTITTESLTLAVSANLSTWRPAAYCFIICNKD